MAGDSACSTTVACSVTAWRTRALVRPTHRLASCCGVAIEHLGQCPPGVSYPRQRCVAPVLSDRVFQESLSTVGGAACVSVVIVSSDPEGVDAFHDASAGLSLLLSSSTGQLFCKIGWLEHLGVQRRNMFIRRSWLLSEMKEIAFLKVCGLHDLREAFCARGLFAVASCVDPHSESWSQVFWRHSQQSLPITTIQTTLSRTSPPCARPRS